MKNKTLIFKSLTANCQSNVGVALNEHAQTSLNDKNIKFLLLNKNN